MIHESHIGSLKELSARALHRELRREITDSLQDLVACVEPALPLEGNTLHACVIDDFQIQHIELDGRECRVHLSFTASARHGISADKKLERISGRADSVLDDRGCLTYCGAVFSEEPAFVGHDLGGSD
jgi:hypothetical protein